MCGGAKKNRMEQTLKLANPFTPGNGLDPPYLAGREHEDRLFRRSLARAENLPQNLVITGLRGTGKTVLLRNLARLAGESGWVVVEREFGERYCREKLLIEAFAADLSAKMVGLSISGEARITEVGKGVYSVAGVHRWSEGPGPGEPPEDYLARLLGEAAEAAVSAGKKGLVLVCDEFQGVRDGKHADEYPLSLLLAAVSRVQREAGRCLVVLGGLPPLLANLTAARTYSERMFAVRSLSHLSPPESREAIQRPLEGSGRVLEGPLIDALAEETSGYPYFLQFYCHYLLENILKPVVALDDFRAIRPHLLWELDTGFFRTRYERASAGERGVLLAIARAGAAAGRRQIKEGLDAALSSQALQVNLGRLEEKGLIYRERRGVYGFTLPLFRDYLLRLERDAAE